MADCAHEQFEAQVSVRVVTPTTGITPYHQARLQVRCAQCQGPLTFGALPPHNPLIFLTVATGAGGSELYLSGVVVPPTPSLEGQTWTRVVMPEPETKPEPEKAAATQ